jgi:hypothetical protein
METVEMTQSESVVEEVPSELNGLPPAVMDEPVSETSRADPDPADPDPADPDTADPDTAGDDWRISVGLVPVR